MIDRHFTPEWIAKQLVELLPSDGLGAIADFTAGRGALLEAAQMRFGAERRYIATDHHRATVDNLRRRKPEWEVGSLDVFVARSRSASRQWRLLGGTVDTVVANPPFSFRGGRRVAASPGTDLHATPAMAFMNLVATRIAPGGLIAAILPSNALRGEGDAAVRRELNTLGDLKVIEEYRRDAFPNVFASTCLVRFERSPERSRLDRDVEDSAPSVAVGGGQVSIVRGTAQVFSFDRGSGAPGRLLHTSHLVAGKAVPDGPLGCWRRHAKGPFVTLPRVGVPNPSKIAVVGAGSAFIPSDCVFALEVSTDAAAESLKADLLMNWDLVADSFSGSCAPYTTVTRVKKLLRRLGYAPSQDVPNVSASAMVGRSRSGR